MPEVHFLLKAIHNLIMILIILPKKSCAILFNWIFDNLILAEELFAKALPNFGTCVLINNNLWERVSSSSSESPTTFDKISKITLVLFYI